MLETSINHLVIQPQPKLLPGLEGLESYVEKDTYVYILRFIFSIISRSSKLRESKGQLHQRIIQFERDSELPGFMSALPIEQLLEQLDDAQYVYKIFRRDRPLPKFH